MLDLWLIIGVLVGLLVYSVYWNRRNYNEASNFYAASLAALMETVKRAGVIADAYKEVTGKYHIMDFRNPQCTETKPKLYIPRTLEDDK